MDHRVVRTYWQVTLILLALALAGHEPAMGGVLALNFVQALHFTVARRTLRALDVQVRWFYLGLLVIGLLEPMAWLHPLQFVGLFANMSVDYCLAARVLMLMPWNRTWPLSLRLIVRTLTMAPAPGSIAGRVAALG